MALPVPTAYAENGRVLAESFSERQKVRPEATAALDLPLELRNSFGAS